MSEGGIRDKVLKKVQQRSQAVNDLAFGKVPPQAPDLEQAVLGALMLERDALTNVIDILGSNSFYVESHQKIYAAIQGLFEAGHPVDLLTVTQELKKRGDLELVGGAFFLTELTNRISSSAHAEYHAHIISQKHIQRELIRVSSEIIKDAYEDTTDVFELLDKAEKNLFSITEGNLRSGSDSMQVIVKKAIKAIDELKDQEEGLTGVPSGFMNLDRVTSGWQPSDLVILAARPAMGKTAFVLSAARNAAVQFNKGVAVFSLEMSSVQLVNRLIAGEAEIPMEKLKKGQLADHEWQQLNTRVTKLAEAPLFIDDTPALNIFELRAKCRRLKANHDIQMIIIDYLQLMSGGKDSKGGNREQEIAAISRGLKMIAKELMVPVIALSQLSRAVETRGGDKRPMLSDLRESGSIEQDADMVCFLYRPEYYGITEDADGNSTEGVGEVMIAKHRNGALENVPLKFVGKYAKFENLDHHAFGDGGMGAGMQQLEDGSSFTTLRSKMDEDFGAGGFPDDDVPF